MYQHLQMIYAREWNWPRYKASLYSESTVSILPQKFPLLLKDQELAFKTYITNLLRFKYSLKYLQYFSFQGFIRSACISIERVQKNHLKNLENLLQW